MTQSAGDRSRLDGAGGGVPGDGDAAAEIGLVGHVACQRGIVAEDSVLRKRLARFDGTEKRPEVRAHVVKVVAFVDVIFEERLLADLRIVLRMPLLEVSLAHGLREAVRVIAGRGIFARLRIMSDAELGDFKNSVRTLEAVSFGIVAAEIEAEID